MTVPIGSIECSNSHCGHGNPASAKVCAACGAPLLHLYLYGIGSDLRSLAPGTWLANRYYYLGDRRFLDGKPGQVPEVPGEVTRLLLSYLRLVEHRPQVPQIYGVVKQSNFSREAILLLEGAPIGPDGSLLPKLVDQWAKATPLRQLNWLWQVARLWEPLQDAGVTATLLEPERLRVGSGWVRLLALKDNAGRSPSWAEWGRWWVQRLRPHPALESLVSPLLQQVALGNCDPPTLVANLEQLITQVAAQDAPVELAVASLSDPGPSRSRNEDACYPFSQDQTRGQRLGLAIVCDGLGGHEGGDVASRWAIEQLTTELVPFVEVAAQAPPSPELVNATLLRAIGLANAVITQRNVQEGRAERQRMGTTVVLALVIDRWLYIAHVGDSRAYQITPTGCYALTLDDDLATRETRLGLGFYRDLLQISAAGALVQALGMGNSEQLYPSVRRLVLDEDCAIVLCSDGVSDFDLIERSWRDQFPVRWGQGDPGQTVAQMIALANQHNGHDNATISLVQIGATRQLVPDPARLRRPVMVPSPPLDRELEVSPTANPNHPNSFQGDDLLPSVVAKMPQTELVTPSAEPSSIPPEGRSPLVRSPWVGRWFSLLALVIFGGGLLALVIMPLVRQLVDANAPNTPAPSPTPIASPSGISTTPSPVPSPMALNVGEVLQIKPQAAALGLYGPDRTTLVGWLPPNSTIQILRISLPIAPVPTTAAPTATPIASPPTDDHPSGPPPGLTWVELKICTLGRSNPNSSLASGATLWARQADLGDRVVAAAPLPLPNGCQASTITPDAVNNPP